MLGVLASLLALALTRAQRRSTPGRWEVRPSLPGGQEAGAGDKFCSMQEAPDALALSPACKQGRASLPQLT